MFTSRPQATHTICRTHRGQSSVETNTAPVFHSSSRRLKLFSYFIVFCFYVDYFAPSPHIPSPCPVQPQVCPPAHTTESHHARPRPHGGPGRPSGLEAQSDAGRTAAAAATAATSSTATAATVPQTTSTQSTSRNENLILSLAVFWLRTFILGSKLQLIGGR